MSMEFAVKRRDRQLVLPIQSHFGHVLDFEEELFPYIKKFINQYDRLVTRWYFILRRFVRRYRLPVIRNLALVTTILFFAFAPVSDLLSEQLPSFASLFPKTQQAQAALDTRIYLNVSDLGGLATSSWTVPVDWNNASNSIEVIGAGGAGGDGSSSVGAGGGGGGGYSRINNLNFAAASTSIPFAVGASGSSPGNGSNGTAGGHTWFGKGHYGTGTNGCFSAGPTVCVSAEGGEGGSADGQVASASGGGHDFGGGVGASASGTTKFAGGNGGRSLAGSSTDSNAGGGGAGGPGGSGKSADKVNGTTNTGGSGGGGAGGGTSSKGSTNSSGNGGNGGNGPGGSGGGPGGAGAGGWATAGGAGGAGGAATFAGGLASRGIEFDSTHGAGGGGGGAGDNGATGGNGGRYGGGGGGGATCGTACRGGNGLIIITYRAIPYTTISTTGTQQNILTNTTNQFLGGAFTLTRNSGTATVSSIGVTLSGTGLAASDIANMKLYTDTVASCTTTSGFSTQVGSTIASPTVGKNTFGSLSLSVGTTPVCIYVVIDTTGTSAANDTVEASIAAATDVVADAGGNVTGTAAIAGTTTINSSTIDISGSAKQSDGTTNIAETGTNTISVAVNGVLQGQSQGTVGGGTWTVSTVTVAINDIVTVFIEGEAASSSQAAAVTKYGGSGNIGSMQLIEGSLTIGSDQNNTITNTNLSQYDSSVSGKKTLFDVDGSSNLSVDVDSKVTGDKLIIAVGDTYQPDSVTGRTNTFTNLNNLGTITADANTFTASGSWDNNGTFTAGTSTVTMAGTGTLDGHGGDSFSSLTINSSGTVTASGSFTVSSTLTSTAGILSIPSGATLTHSGATLTLSGTISGSGTLKETASGFTFPTGGTISSILKMDTVNGNQILSARTYGGAVKLDNSGATTGRTVTLSSTTTTFSGGIDIAESGTGDVLLTGSSNNPTVNITGDLICSSGTLNNLTTGSGTWTISGNLNFNNCNTITTTGGTFTMSGTGTLTSNSKTLNSLNLSGTITLANATHAVVGNLDLTGGTITAGSSTITMSGTANTITGGGQTLNNLTIDPSSAGVITLQTSDLTVTGTLTIASNDKFKVNTGLNLTLSGTGTPLSISGTFEPATGSTVTYTGSTATVTSATFGSLTLDCGTTCTLPSSGTPTIKGTLMVNSGTSIASGSATILFRGGTGVTNHISDGNVTKQNFGEIAVQASTSGNSLLTMDSSIKVASATINSSQTLDAGGTNTLTIQGSTTPFTINGTFTSQTGTVQYIGGGTVNVAIPSSVYNNLILGGTGTYVLPASDITLRGDMTVTTGSAVTKSTNNKLVFAEGGTQTLTSNATNSDLGIIQVSVNGGNNSTLALGSAVKITSVTVDASQILNINGSNTMIITGTGNVFTNNGTFQPRTGTIQYTGTTANVTAMKYKHLTLGGTGTYTLPSAGTTTLLGDLILTSGSTIASGSATLFFSGGTTQTVTDNTTNKMNLGEIAVQASTSGNTTLTLGSDLRIASATIDVSQTLDASGSNTLTITNSNTPFTVDGAFTRSTGIVVFKGTAATNVPAINYYDLKLQPSANSTTFTLAAGTVGVSKTFTIGNGTNTGTIITAATNATALDIASVSISINSTLVANASQNLIIGGNFTNNGTFTHSNGTIAFSGSGTHNIGGSSSTTFYGFTDTTAGSTLLFANNGGGSTPLYTFAAGGTVTITGSVNNHIIITSDNQPTNSWLVHFTSSQSRISHVTLSFSDCDGTSAVVNLDVDSTDGGNNGACWNFPVTHGGGPTFFGSGGGSSGGDAGTTNGQSGGTGNEGGGGGSTGGNGGASGGQSGGTGNSGGGGGASPMIIDWWWLISMLFNPPFS